MFLHKKGPHVLTSGQSWLDSVFFFPNIALIQMSEMFLNCLQDGAP